MMFSRSSFTFFLRSHWPSMFLFLSLLSAVVGFELLDLQHPFLSEYTDPSSFISIPVVLLRVMLVAAIIQYGHALGLRIMRLFRMSGSPGLAMALGIVGLNIILMPIFFLRLLYCRVLVGLFLVLSIVLSAEVKESILSILLRFTKVRHLLLFVVFAILFLVGAVSPVDFRESLGDVSSSYLPVPMNCAYYHGACYVPRFNSTMSNFLNGEVLGSAVIVLSNPDVIKLLGAAIFLILVWLVHDLCEELGCGRLSIIAPLVFMACPSLSMQRYFSFAHPRSYFMFLSFLSFLLLSYGFRRKDAKYHYLGLIVMGVLAGATLAGIVSFVVCALLLLFSVKLLWSKRKECAVYVLLAILLALVFPCWNYYTVGSFAPTNMLINRITGAQVNPDMYNQYLWERVALQFRVSEGSSLGSYLLFPLSLVHEQFGIFAIFFLIGLFFLKDGTMGMLYGYVLLNNVVYLFLFNNSVVGGARARFHWVVLPVVSVLIVYAMKRLTSWYEQTLARMRIRGYHVDLAMRYVCLAFILSSVGHSLFTVVSRHVSHGKQQHLYLSGKIDLGSYLGKKHVDKALYFNSNFTSKDKILYMFCVKGIYTKPQLYQPTTSGEASIVYRSEEKDVIMNKLKDVGIKYFCLDNDFYSPGKDRFDRIANNPGQSMIADIVTPIFEPMFFAAHFIPLDVPFSDFYMFKIDYYGIGEADAVDDNFRKINRTGFFQLLYESLRRRGKEAVKLVDNPYNVDTLFNEYKAIAWRIGEHVDKSDAK